MRDIHISVVSHRQYPLIRMLLLDLKKQSYANRIFVTITINIDETFTTDYNNFPFPINLIINNHTKGFSQNHNAAFNQKDLKHKRKYFIVINPDVRLPSCVIQPSIITLDNSSQIGLTIPLVCDSDMNPEDSIRQLPTPMNLLLKLIFGKNSRWDIDKSLQPDWAAGMFMAFKSEVFQEIGGFDEKYFLYYEDVDICSRLWLNRYSLQVVENASIVHDAQRTSRHDFRYFWWHISSMLKFFNSSTYRKVKIFHQQRNKST